MKKVICLILSLVLVLGMAVTAFAATSDPTFNPAPNNPQPGNTFNPAPNNPKPDDYVNPGVTDIVPEEEANPNTGAPVSMLPLVFVTLGAAAAFGKRK